MLLISMSRHRTLNSANVSRLTSQRFSSAGDWEWSIIGKLGKDKVMAVPPLTRRKPGIYLAFVSISWECHNSQSFFGDSWCLNHLIAYWGWSNFILYLLQDDYTCLLKLILSFWKMIKSGYSFWSTFITSLTAIDTDSFWARCKFVRGLSCTSIPGRTMGGTWEQCLGSWQSDAICLRNYMLGYTVGLFVMIIISSSSQSKPANKTNPFLSLLLYPNHWNQYSEPSPFEKNQYQNSPE